MSSVLHLSFTLPPQGPVKDPGDVGLPAYNFFKCMHLTQANIERDETESQEMNKN